MLDHFSAGLDSCLNRIKPTRISAGQSLGPQAHTHTCTRCNYHGNGVRHGLAEEEEGEERGGAQNFTTAEVIAKTPTGND